MTDIIAIILLIAAILGAFWFGLPAWINFLVKRRDEKAAAKARESDQ